MKTWYRIVSYLNTIQTAEVVKETPQFLFFASGRRHLKSSGSENYYPTWQGAHDALLRRARKKLELKHAETQRAGRDLEVIESMTEPQARA